MAVTPNYSWPVPVNTDYVKDGAEAIKDLGDAIDRTVFGLPSGALALVKTQTIGTAVSSVTVSSAFSATYASYKIFVTGRAASANGRLSLQLDGLTASYYSGAFGALFTTGAFTGLAGNNVAKWFNAGFHETAFLAMNVELVNPFLTTNTVFSAAVMQIDSGFGASAGTQESATSATGFVIAPASGTMTGGTIRVYGYQK